MQSSVRRYAKYGQMPIRITTKLKAKVNPMVILARGYSSPSSGIPRRSSKQARIETTAVLAYEYEVCASEEPVSEHMCVRTERWR